MHIKLMAATAAFAALFAAGAAHATAITTSSDFLVNFSGTGGSPSLTGTATAELGDFTFGMNSVSFEMIVTNTSTTPIDARFTALGWVTAPAATSSTDTTNVYSTTTNVGLGPDNLSVCFYSGMNCNGGSNGGLEDPANDGLHGDPTTTGVFGVTINFASAVPPLDFSQFDGKFQTANGSFFAAGTVSACTPSTCVINPLQPGVPEPSSLSILGGAMLAVSLWWQRRRRLS
jgi:hypothetical protein